MSAGTLISVEDYLKMSYSNDREYRDGVVLERKGGDIASSRLQATGFPKRDSAARGDGRV